MRFSILTRCVVVLVYGRLACCLKQYLQGQPTTIASVVGEGAVQTVTLLNEVVITTNLVESKSFRTLEKAFDKTTKTNSGMKPGAIDSYLKIDLGSESAVGSLIIMQKVFQGGTTVSSAMEVYISNTSSLNIDLATTTKCETMETGLTNCVGIGRYIIIKHLDNQPFVIQELLLYDSKDLAQEGTVDTENIVWDDVGVNVNSFLVGTTSRKMQDCMSGTMGATQSFFVISVDYGATEIVLTDVILYTWLIPRIKFVKVKAYDAAGNPTLCSSLEIKPSAEKFEHHVSCAARIEKVQKVVIEVTPGQNNGEVVNICKIGIFDSQSTNHVNWTDKPHEIVMLADVDTQKITLPTFTDTQFEGVEVTWTLYDAETNGELPIANYATFTLTELIFNTPIIPIKGRQDLSSTKRCYFKGVITQTNQFEVTGNTQNYHFDCTFKDDCASAVIQPTDLTHGESTWGTASTMNFPAFTDSVGDTTCGRHLLTLKTPPDFLSVEDQTQNSVGARITFTYDDSQALASDVRVHTINYEVTSESYPNDSIPPISDSISPISGSLEFEIRPELMPDLSWDSSKTYTIDMISETNWELQLPSVTMARSSQVPIWKIYDESKVEVTDFSINAAQTTAVFALPLTTISDRLARFGKKKYAFVGEFTNPNEGTGQYIFEIDFEDGCRSSTISSQTLSLIEFQYNENGSKTLSAFKDSIDEAGIASQQGICGEKTVTVLGALSYLSITQSNPVTADFSINYDSGLAGNNMLDTLVEFNVESKEYNGLGVAQITVSPFTMSFVDATYTITNDESWSPTVQIVNLFTAAGSASIDLPTLSVTPDEGKLVVWKIVRKSDSQDFTSEFTISSSTATYMTPQSDIIKRLDLAPTNIVFFFQGTIATAVVQKSQKYEFTIDFQDQCRTSTINLQTINLSSVQSDASKSQTITSFKDSIDTLNTYPTGICGEKLVTLDDANTFAFLSVVPNAVNKLTEPFSINFDHKKAKSTDIGTHIITYTVSSKYYGPEALVPDIKGTFSFTINSQAGSSNNSSDEITNIPTTTSESCPITQEDINNLQSNLSNGQPFEVSNQAGKVGYASLSYADHLVSINTALGFDDQAKKKLCGGDITVSLVSPYAFIMLNIDAQSIDIVSDDTTKAGVNEEAKLIFGIGSDYNLQLAIRATFTECTITQLRFENPLLDLTYSIGSGIQLVSLPNIIQKPDCSFQVNQFTMTVLQSDQSVENVLTLDSWAKALIIDTNDLNFNGQRVEISIRMEQSLLPQSEIKDLTVNIDFTDAVVQSISSLATGTSTAAGKAGTSPDAALQPKNPFGIDIAPLTCRPRTDREWSFQLPPSESTIYKLSQSGDYYGYFEMDKSRKVSISAEKLVSFIFGPECDPPGSNSEIWLEFILLSEENGNSIVKVYIPITSGSINGDSDTADTSSDQATSLSNAESGQAGNQNSKSGTFDGWKTLLDQNIELVEEDKKDTEKLQVQSIKITAIGRLKIKFTKPIVLDRLISFNKSAGDISGDRNLQGRALTIEDAIYVRIKEEDFFREEGINKGFTIAYVGAESTQLELQINFERTNDITPNIREPDTLEVLFVDPSFFIDAETGLTLDQESRKVNSLVQPQYTKEQYEEAELQAGQVASAGIALQAVELIIIFAFQKVLFSMWTLILTVQFLVFMSYWQVQYPNLTRFLIHELRKIALGEFLDDFAIGEKIRSILGIESGAQDDKIEQNMGDERLDSSGDNAFATFGPTFILATLAFLTIIIVILLCLNVCRKDHAVCTKCRKCLKQIVTKLFFNPVIRYLLLNALKFYFGGLVVFSADLKNNNEDSSNIVIPIAIILVVSIAAIFLTILLKRKQKILKDKTILLKIGTLYQGRDVSKDHHKAYLLPLTFFLRRFLFIVVTVYIINYPQTQMLLMHFLSMATMIYLSDRSLSQFSSRTQKWIEVGSELLLHLICILLSQFNDIRLNEEIRNEIQNCVLASVGILFLLNFGFLVYMIVMNCKEKYRLKALEAMKAKMQKKRAELKLRRTTTRINQIAMAPSLSSFRSHSSFNSNSSLSSKSFSSQSMSNSSQSALHQSVNQSALQQSSSNSQSSSSLSISMTSVLRIQENQKKSNCSQYSMSSSSSQISSSQLSSNSSSSSLSLYNTSQIRSNGRRKSIINARSSQQESSQQASSQQESSQAESAIESAAMGSSTNNSLMQGINQFFGKKSEQLIWGNDILPARAKQKQKSQHMNEFMADVDQELQTIIQGNLNPNKVNKRRKEIVPAGIDLPAIDQADIIDRNRLDAYRGSDIDSDPGFYFD